MPGRAAPDLAFADTVFVDDLEVPPASGVIIDDVTVDAPPGEADLSPTSVRLLWDATAEQGSFGRRVQAMASCYAWDRADVLRGAWMALAVLVIVATGFAILSSQVDATAFR